MRHITKTVRCGMALMVVGALVAGCESKTTPPAASTSAPMCETLAKASMPGLTIAEAKTVAAGAFTPPAPANGNAPAAFSDLPAFCRVVGTLKSGEKTESRVEFWLPEQGWNGDFQPAGSSFWGGSIPYGRMREILKSGAATAASNLGHDGTGPSFAKDDRQLLKALGDVPFHDLLDRGKVLINTYYSKGPTFTLMDECGGGGSRDVLAEIQRHPKDLDIGAAIGFTNYGTHHGVAHMWVYNATHKTPASFIPESKYKLIHDAALAACDMKDGVKDGVIEDPPRCGFDPGTLTCKGGDSPTCLTAPQVAAVRTIYQTPVHARTKAVIYGSMPPGTEMGWDEMAGPVPYPYSVTFYKYLVFNDEKWDYKTRPVNFDADLDKADAPENYVINLQEADISPYLDNGGKLLMVGGWNDHTLGPGNNVDYYEAILKKLGPEKTKDSVRLFMVPGMDHCFGDAYGPDKRWPTIYATYFDTVGTLKQWKTSGKAPDTIVVTTKGKEGERKRLVCAYPQVSQYKGSGSTDDPANFVCEMPQ
jgi:feruloyl esterase